MRQKITALFKKHRVVILYLFFGGCTTAVNFVAYYLLYDVLGVQNVPSTAIAWFAAVLFAYITNKIWVFENRCFAAKHLLRESLSFFAARAATGAIDIGIMYLFVDVLHFNALVMKILSNIIVVILNYFFSKFWIFKQNKEEPHQTNGQ